MTKRLTIVVPYRDRVEHFDQFVPHMRAYFARDKLDRAIPYRVLIIEQGAGEAFNRGMLKNIGFRLGQDRGDYTCFHDLDYLPLWADYSWVAHPTRIVRYGAEERPLAPGRSHLVMSHDLATFFGGVVLAPNTAFATINGYSNRYWGWGCEDSDLRRRYLAAGIEIGVRDGTFIALDHDHDGYTPDGAAHPIATVNRALLEAKWAAGGGTTDDGLSNLDFDIQRRVTIPDPAPEREALWELVTVRLAGGPSAEQREALAAPGIQEIGGRNT